MAQNAGLLAFMTHECRLVNLLGRTRDSDFHLCGIIQYSLGHLLDFRRHRSRKHQRLTLFRQLLDYLHYVVIKAHVKHTVGLVEYEI